MSTKKWSERAIGSGNSPSISGNLGGSGSRETVSQVAVRQSDQPGASYDQFKQTNGSLLNQLDDLAGTNGQPNATLCYAVNRTMHYIENMIQ